MNKSGNPEENSYAGFALVCLLIIGVWSLVSLPIIFFYLPKSEMPPNTNGSTNTSYYSDSDVCLAPLQYATTSGVCLTEIANILVSSNCPSDPEAYLLVMRNEEATATQLINGFTSLGASAECLSNAVPFLCLHLFGLCGEPGVSIQPTSNQCEEVRDTTCKQEWMFLEKLDIGLPECEIFPDKSLSCLALNDSHSTNGRGTTNVLDLVERHSSNITLALLDCTGDYYQENGSSYCTRSCYTWVKWGNGIWIIGDVLFLLLTSTSFLGSTAIIMISCLAHKRMLIFPAIFIVYLMIDYMILDLSILLTFMDRRKFLCPSRSLIKSLREVTLFCVISGILNTYISTQITLWWLFHIVILFWKVIFPFHARSFEASGKNKYIHITCIIVGVLLPLVPIIIIMADTAVDLQKQNENTTRNNLFLSEGLGFGYNGFPTSLCQSTNSDAYFYSGLLMVDGIFGCGCTMLIIIFWSVHKFYIKRKRVEKNLHLNINTKAGHQFRFGTAEKKLLTVLCYTVAYAAMTMTVYTLEIRMGAHNINNLQKFLFCELGSNNSSNTCIFLNPDIVRITFLYFSAILFSLGPFVNLLYAVNIQELKELWNKWPWSMVHKYC